MGRARHTQCVHTPTKTKNDISYIKAPGKAAALQPLDLGGRSWEAAWPAGVWGAGWGGPGAGPRGSQGRGRGLVRSAGSWGPGRRPRLGGEASPTLCALFSGGGAAAPGTVLTLDAVGALLLFGGTRKGCSKGYSS